MAPHQERVVQEKKELDEKIQKLVAFTSTETYRTLSCQEIVWLNLQLVAMTEYSRVLGERIAAFA